MKIRCLLLFAAAVLAAHAPVHVSPSGDDANPGTEAPVRARRHARDLGRAAKSFHRHPPRRPLSTHGAPETRRGRLRRNVNGAQDRSAGHYQRGFHITGWKLTEGRRALWSAPAALGNTRQRYTDGSRASRTRGRLPVGLTKTETGYPAANSLIASGATPRTSSFVHTVGNAIWSEPSAGLGS
jgi:hypothetical protein